MGWNFRSCFISVPCSMREGALVWEETVLAGLLRTQSGTCSLAAACPSCFCAKSSPPSCYSLAHVPSSRAAASVHDLVMWQQHKHQTLTCSQQREFSLFHIDTTYSFLHLNCTEGSSPREPNSVTWASICPQRRAIWSTGAFATWIQVPSNSDSS